MNYIKSLWYGLTLGVVVGLGYQAALSNSWVLLGMCALYSGILVAHKVLARPVKPVFSVFTRYTEAIFAAAWIYIGISAFIAGSFLLLAFDVLQLARTVYAFVENERAKDADSL